MKKRNYFDFINDIDEAITDIENFVKSMKYNQFTKDKKTINAVIRSLEVIGEAAKKIPGSVKKQYDEVPWKQMMGMRDKLIHEYFGVDTEIIWQVTQTDLPPVKSFITKMLREHTTQSSLGLKS